MNAALTWARANASAWAATIFGWIKRALVAIWASFAALLKSPAVWAACTVVFVAGFSVGHIERGRPVRALKQKVAVLETDNATLTATLAATRARSASLAEALAKARQEAADAKVPSAAAAPAKITKRRVAATPAPAKAVPAPTLFRNPFGG